MPISTASVGEGAVNKTDDVALGQAMLRIVTNAKNLPYLAGSYDGSYAATTKDAIISFQKDHAKVIQAGQAGKEKEGVVDAGGTTFATLAAALPATHKELRIIPNTKTVYLEAIASDAIASAAAIRTDAEFEATFKANLASLVETIYTEHRIALWITPTGRRRTFAQQAAETQTHAGPGESNHNFGRASDIGFRGLRWIQGNGAIKKDDDWLNSLNGASAAKANALWDARDALAAKIPLYRLQFERIHLQLFDQATFNNPRSLVRLLNTVGKAKWDTGYKSDLGLGGALFPVGSAKQIWAGTATVAKADLAKALTAKTGKLVKEADIKVQQIAETQKALKADFEAADKNWIKWVKVP